jgi:hypothetical protein
LQVTAGAVSITTVVSITTAPYAAVFSQLKFFFRLFSFFAVNFKQIHTRNKKKKFEKKMPYWLKKRLKKIFFSRRRFLISVFVGGEQFSPNFKQYSNRPLCTNACCQKSEGVLGRLF